MFQAPLKNIIKLNIEYYDIENSTDCTRDYLQILDYAAPNKTKLTPRLCGLHDPPQSRDTAAELNFTSYLHHFHVAFSSDKSNSPRGGFTISYKVLPGMLFLVAPLLRAERLIWSLWHVCVCVCVWPVSYRQTPPPRLVQSFKPFHRINWSMC